MMYLSYVAQQITGDSSLLHNEYRRDISAESARLRVLHRGRADPSCDPSSLDKHVMKVPLKVRDHPGPVVCTGASQMWLESWSFVGGHTHTHTGMCTLTLDSSSAGLQTHTRDASLPERCWRAAQTNRSGVSVVNNLFPPLFLLHQPSFHLMGFYLEHDS